MEFGKLSLANRGMEIIKKTLSETNFETTCNLNWEIGVLDTYINSAIGEYCWNIIIIRMSIQCNQFGKIECFLAVLLYQGST